MINDYAKFVDTTTSDASRNTSILSNRVLDLRGTHGHVNGNVYEAVEVARLMTAVIGMMAESGEFAEVVKKKICLLYTSPSPRDAHESRMPSSA